MAALSCIALRMSSRCSIYLLTSREISDSADRYDASAEDTNRLLLCVAAARESVSVAEVRCSVSCVGTVLTAW